MFRFEATICSRPGPTAVPPDTSGKVGKYADNDRASRRTGEIAVVRARRSTETFGDTTIGHTRTMFAEQLEEVVSGVVVGPMS